jgi:hypothetical protein
MKASRPPTRTRRPGRSASTTSFVRVRRASSRGVPIHDSSMQTRRRRAPAAGARASSRKRRARYNGSCPRTSFAQRSATIPSSRLPLCSSYRRTRCGSNLLEEATATEAAEAPAGEPGSKPDLWATEVRFHGGSFLVPFGHDAGAEFVVRHLALALFALYPPLDEAAARPLARLLSAGLAAGELVLRRTGVDRHALPVESDAIVVPDARRLDELRVAATITEADLARVLG